MTGDLPDAPAVTVIGAGQAGLATGYYLEEHGLDAALVADDNRVGDTWRNRWDSLRLFTPAFYNGLPGMAFPADDPEYLPTADEVADYLESYAARFDLPVHLKTRVTGVRREDSGFNVETAEESLRTDALVVATGAYRHPSLPAVADELPADVFSCHSSEYRNPSQLAAGDTLVVGAGNSGTQIATEIAAADDDRDVWLVGPETGEVPRRLLGRDFYRWAVPTIFRLTRDGLLGRHLYERTAGEADPVFRPELEQMREAGVERVIGRVSDVVNGRPATGDGRRFDAANVIWCTGFEPDYSWLDLDIFRDDGYPRHSRGVVTEVPGLYFVGLPWQHRATSPLLGGVGRDAEYITDQIRSQLVGTGA